MKGKYHPAAANESHKNWTGYDSIYESDYENTSFEPTLGETTPLWMRVWYIAESLGSGTKRRAVPSEWYRQYR